MKVKFLSILAALALIAACENFFVTSILPDRNGGDDDVPPGSFVVTFDRNGGDSDADPKTKVVTPPATTIDELPAQPKWADHAFTGWNTQEDGSGAVFSGDTPVTADITVYAQWLDVPEGSFVVTFDSNGGDTDADPAAKVVTPPATTIDELPDPPIRDGYEFAGWNTQADGNGTAFTASTTVSADITVYAKWTQGETPPQTPPVVVDFEDDAIGKTYESTGGYANDQPVSPTVKVVADPANAGQKSLEISSTGYNQAAIIPITLPAGKTLNDAESFSFRIRLTTGTISYKEVQVYAASNPATFEHGGFGNPANSPYAQFAVNKLGETETIPELTLNQWNDYSISISGLNSAISNLSGTIYLAIGIQHSDTEAITYLLDDLTFTFGAPQPPPEPGAPVKVDFENDAINKTYEFTQGNNSPTSVKVVADPVNAGQKSLEFTGTSGYNQASVIPINLPNALNTYKSFTFRFNMKTGTLENKDMMVYVADSADKFSRYGFGNAEGNNNFANLLLGQARLTDVKNQWDTYAIAIENPVSAISNLSGNVFIAIGINHNDGIVYYLDDLTFSSEVAPPPPPPPAFPTLVTFEDDAINKAYGFTRGDNDPTVTVAADPANASQKSLRVVTSNSSAWNQAAVIPINLPDALSTYRSFRFRFNLQTSGTLLDNGQPRKINVYVADNTEAFKRYSFGNPANHTNQDQQFANLLVGEVTPDYGETGNWVDYAVNFNNPGSAINSLSGNVYVAIGINHNTGITYYLDDLTFNKQELQKQPGAALSGTLTVSGITASSVNINAGSVSVPSGSTQTIEYSVSLTSAGAPGVWQTEVNFHGLTSETSYTAYARSAANALYNAGAATSSAPFSTLGKADGATLSGTITEIDADRRHNRIIIVEIAAPGNGQTVEYAYSTTNSASESVWQDSTAFIRLTPSTAYYIFARAKENDNNKAGTAITGGPFTTSVLTAPPVTPSVVDFENKSVGDTYNRVSGQGSSSAAVIADPAHAGEKSLQITSNNWNNGAIIPINLPFALKNYESFTFRYRLGTSMPESNRGNGIWVYVTDSPSSLANNQLGNNNASYTSILLKNIVPDYGVINQWEDCEIELVDVNGASIVPVGIQNLSGDVFLVIGINSQQSITYQLDDLTFNIDYDFTPTPLINPTTAIYDLNASNAAQHKAIEIAVSLYGSTLSSITNGATPLTSGTQYTHVNDIVTLPISYLDTLTVGTAALVFTFSDATTKTFTITIRNTAGTLTKYDFTTLSWSSIQNEIRYTGTITASLENGALKVVKTSNNTAAKFILPFNLGSTNLSDYSSVRLMVKASSGDYGNKRFMVEVTNNETFNSTLGGDTNIGYVQNFNFSTSSFTELSVTRTLTDSTAANFQNTIWIAFSIGGTTNSNPYTIEIQSIELVPKP